MNLKFFSAKLLLIPFLALNVASASASIYKITFSTTDITNVTNEASINGVLDGFIVVDESLADSDYTNSTSNAFLFGMPDWLISASFTFTNTSGDVRYPTVTMTTDDNDFAFLYWRTNDGTLTLTDGTTGSEFADQMTRFAFGDFEGTFMGPTNVSGSNLPGMQVYDDEFRVDTSATEAVPGPLPILGIAPLAWYFRKLKKKSLNLK